LFGKIKHHGGFMRITTQKRHKAIVACGRLFHDAGVAADNQWLLGLVGFTHDGLLVSPACVRQLRTK
jgi:hypothetical protein